MSMPSLVDTISIRGRFHRSVQLARDWHEGQYLQEYLLTPTARGLAMQILRSLQTPNGIRAWSITGPYGTGKSAFALFLTGLLTQFQFPHPAATELRAEIGFEGRPFVPVLLMGQRTPLVPALLQAVADAMQSINLPLAEQAHAAAHSTTTTGISVATLLEGAAQSALDAGYGGLLVILDEFGKFLEYATLHPEEEDLIVLQHAAEAANRSTAPLVLITILHTSFAEYLHTINHLQRIEWQKVQGRFVDVAFQEPAEQLLRLIGAALDHTLPNKLAMAYEQTIATILRSSALDEARRRLPLDKLLQNCLPLHPVTALLLWPLFRSKLAQNERSLFAFLASQEAFGFREFLAAAPADPDRPIFYQVCDLYDYICTALGSAVFLGDRAHRWAELRQALDRVPARCGTIAQAIIKTIGLIGLYGGAVGLRASQETLRLSLGDPESVDGVLAELQHLSIIVYRRHEDAYGLWEGSDVDLDACMNQARTHVGQGALASRLKAMVDPRPFVARAHYVHTGTLRYFAVDIMDGTEPALRQRLAQPVVPADGQILYILTRSAHERRRLIDLACTWSSEDDLGQQLRLLAFPRPMVGLEEALLVLEGWIWIRENVQALQGDPVARREVQARILNAHDLLESTAGRTLGLRGHLFDPAASDWVQGGNLQLVRTVREFTHWLSTLCDEVYCQAPVLRNELLNRDYLSTAAAKARRNLIEAMLTHGSVANLDLTGYPPEVSMYRSVLLAGGFHQSVSDQWRFKEPNLPWQPVWHAILQFLESSQAVRRSVLELIALLRQPPYGLRQGPIPVLLLAALLAHQDDVALYENGIFIPELRIEVFERLLRVPEDFEIQQYAFSQTDREAFAALDEAVTALHLPKQDSDGSQLLRIVKPLVLFAVHLPTYSKHTRRVDPSHAAVRDTLLKARDPYALLSKELPAALSMTSWLDPDAETFARSLKNCLLDLQRAYPRLLDEIEDQVRNIFDLQGTTEEVRQRLRARATPLVNHTADRTLSLLVREASRADSSDWREAIGRVVNNGQPPSQWRDADAAGFQARIRQLASDFARLEELVAEQRQSGASHILRIGLFDGHMQELREIVSITPERAPLVDLLSERIAQLLEEETDQSDESRRVRLAALAQAAARYLQTSEVTNDG